MIRPTGQSVHLPHALSGSLVDHTATHQYILSITSKLCKVACRYIHLVPQVPKTSSTYFDTFSTILQCGMNTFYLLSCHFHLFLTLRVYMLLCSRIPGLQVVGPE